jgi:phage FluMu protein Com
LFPSVRSLLEIEPPYKLDFIVDVLSNEYGEKIYKCPRCKNLSGTAAPINPADTSLFHHNPHCINKGRIPIENRR